MKKTTKKASPARKLLPAAASLLISAAMLSTSTYAWFTMNKTVTVNGMTVKTKVSGNLLICEDNVEANYSANPLTQSRTALLEPVSTVSGLDGSFFYTLDAKADGSKNKATSVLAYEAYAEDTALSVAAEKTATGKTNYDDDFNGSVKGYNIATANNDTYADYNTAFGYVDYTFYLKGTADATDNVINLTKCNLLYNGAAIDNSDKTVGKTADKAWRVAVFADDITAQTHAGALDAVVPSGTGKTAKSILTLNTAANHDGTAVATSTTKSAASYNTKATIGTIDKTTPGTSAYYKVVVRLWLEGEDTTCTSETYAKLTNAYTLDLEFKLEAAGTTAADAITSVVPSA